VSVSGPTLTNYLNKINRAFGQYFDPSNNNVDALSIDFKHISAPITSSFALTLYYDLHQCRDYIKNWLLSEFTYLSADFIDADLDKIITPNTNSNLNSDKNIVKFVNTLVNNIESFDSSRLLIRT
jgi:hypothetical protein